MGTRAIPTTFTDRLKLAQICRFITVEEPIVICVSGNLTTTCADVSRTVALAGEGFLFARAACSPGAIHTSFGSPDDVRKA
jgi:hypothetical protein